MSLNFSSFSMQHLVRMRIALETQLQYLSNHKTSYDMGFDDFIGTEMKPYLDLQKEVAKEIDVRKWKGGDKPE